MSVEHVRREIERQLAEADDRPCGAARGVLFGVALGAAMWGAAGLVWWIL